MTRWQVSPGRFSGWIPDVPDLNDLHYSPGEYATRPLPPESLTMIQWSPPIYDQGSIGSCTANAATRAHAILMRKGWHGHESVDFSRLWLYYETRKRMGTIGEDSGASLRDTMKVLAKKGNCFEYNWRYEPAKMDVEPDFGTYEQARQFQIEKYERIYNWRLIQVLDTLASGFPIIGGFALYESFEKVGADGMVPMPQRRERMLGGHAMCLIGYRDAIKSVLVANSWSEWWGEKGYCWIPYEYITSELCGDFWALKVGENL